MFFVKWWTSKFTAINVHLCTYAYLTATSSTATMEQWISCCTRSRSCHEIECVMCLKLKWFSFFSSLLPQRRRASYVHWIAVTVIQHTFDIYYYLQHEVKSHRHFLLGSVWQIEWLKWNPAMLALTPRMLFTFRCHRVLFLIHFVETSSLRVWHFFLCFKSAWCSWPIY